MSTAEESLCRLLPRIYEAGANPEAWPLLLGALADYLGGTACALSVHNFGLREGTIYQAAGYDPDYVLSYLERYAPLNVWLQQECRYQPAGTISIGQQLVPDAELMASEFYNDWLRPQGLHHRLCGVVLRDHGSAVYLAAMRPRHKEVFGPDEMAYLRQLLPHLEQAVRLHRRLTLLQMERDEARYALDLLPTGILIVGDKGEVLMANRRAEEMLRTQDSLVVRRGALQAVNRDESEKLSGIIAGALQTARGRGTRPGGALAVSRRSAARPLNVLVSPMRSSDPIFGKRRAAAAAFVSDPEQKLNVDEERLRQLYDLTLVEARLAWQIAEGRSVEEAAVALRIAISSARTYLKRIFYKTGARRQAELVRLLLIGPAQLRGGKGAYRQEPTD